MSEQRKLATIMAVDVAGYSRAAETDEATAAAAVRRLRGVIDAVIAPLGGRVFNTAGDGFMIELATASAGMEAATQILAAPDAPRVRIGLHLGEVMVAESGDLLGHGVNVAARLQAMAEPGSAIVSQAVQAQIHNARVKLTPLGKVQLDKMHERIDVFALSPDRKRSFGRVAWRRARRALLALLVIGVAGAGGYAAWRAYAPPGTAAIPRLAVLRFETVGETEPYFAETVADELIAHATRMEGLEVIARASSFALEGDRATPQAAARELNANLVLTGSVRRIADRVRVVAQLAEAPNGRQLWTQEFERPLSEVYLLQNEIAARVATAVGLRALPPQGRRVDPQAYDFYVRGREAFSSNDTEAAIALFEQAVERDAEFAAAWAYLSRALMYLAAQRWIDAPPNVPLDPSWQATGFDAANRAIALDPDTPWPYETMSNAFNQTGRWRESLAAAEQATARGGAPASIYASLGYLQRANEAARRRVEHDPLNARAWSFLGQYCKFRHDLDCALDAFQRERRLDPNVSPFYLAMTLHRAGRTAEALDLTRQQQEVWRDFFAEAAPFNMQLMHAMMGEGETPTTPDLIATLQRGAYVENLIDVFIETNRGEDAAQLLQYWTPASRPGLWFLYDYPLAPMRARPEFWALMDREGILNVWREVGPPDFCEQEPVCDQYLRQ
jgi:TolB-like protein/class 3 adenylate cyclase